MTWRFLRLRRKVNFVCSISLVSNRRDLRVVSIITQRAALHHNSADTPLTLADKYNTVLILLAERRRHAAGCRKLLRYRLFSRRFRRTENACGAVRCFALRYPHVMTETRRYCVPCVNNM